MESVSSGDTTTIKGVPWFTYNNNIVSTIYVNDDSFLGFGSSDNHLSVNYRTECNMWSLYREEGTLNDNIKFLKIKWSGFSHYRYSNDYNRLEYDVILWSTGDISLHMIYIPANYIGEYSLDSVNYTVSASAPDITFIKSKTGGFTHHSNTIISFPSYLVRSDSKYYTIVDNALYEIENSELTSNMFVNMGLNYVPPFSLISELNNPEILYWSDMGKEPEEGLVLDIEPNSPQFVYYENQDMTDYLGIEIVDCAASEDVIFSISIDDGQTWKYYKDGNWKVVESDLEGMSINTLRSITTENWAEVLTATAFKFRCVLPAASSYASKIFIKYI